eukprot:1443715-Amphidinium_carterae.1
MEDNSLKGMLCRVCGIATALFTCTLQWYKCVANNSVEDPNETSILLHGIWNLKILPVTPERKGKLRSDSSVVDLGFPAETFRHSVRFVSKLIPNGCLVSRSMKVRQPVIVEPKSSRLW